jgi:2-dehydro-3-deoxygluconokinase
VTVLAAIGEGLAELSLADGRDDTALSFGGDAANVCVMAARLGARTRLGGRVGDDALGRRLLAFWRAHGIELDGVRQDPGAATGLYVNEASAGGHRFVYYRRGSAGSRFAPDDVAPAFLERVGTLVVTGVTLAVSPMCAAAAWRAIELARERGVRVACVLNHRPALGGDVDELVRAARASDVAIGSREDAAAVLGTRDPERIRAALRDGPAELVLTDGADPALVVAGGEAVAQPVPAVAVRNAAGAGDALAGAYLAARLRGDAPARSLAWGVAAATLSVQEEGCASAYPSAEATAALLGRLAPGVPA